MAGVVAVALSLIFEDPAAVLAFPMRARYVEGVHPTKLTPYLSINVDWKCRCYS